MTGCAKVKFETKPEAKHALAMVRARFRHRRSGRLHPYRCGSCGYWHLGHLAVEVIRGDMTREQVYGRVPA